MQNIKHGGVDSGNERLHPRNSRQKDDPALEGELWAGVGLASFDKPFGMVELWS